MGQAQENAFIMSWNLKHVVIDLYIIDTVILEKVPTTEYKYNVTEYFHFILQRFHFYQLKLTGMWSRTEDKLYWLKFL